MAFVSRNPNNVLNPETADGCISMNPNEISPGQEFIGFYKHMYLDPVYNNRCYVFKGRDDGKDYLFYGTKSLNSEMGYHGKPTDRPYYGTGDLVCITYKGLWENKKGPYAGKSSRIWKVTGDDAWIPTPEFVQQLQQEVHNRRIEVQRLLGGQQGGNQFPQNAYAVNAGPVHVPQQQMQAQYAQPVHQVNPHHQYQSAPNQNIVTAGYLAPTSVSIGPNSANHFLNPYGNKPTDPFG